MARQIKQGSLLDNLTTPREGTEYWARVQNDKGNPVVIKGVVDLVFNIDNRGYANIYVDFHSGEKKYHLPINVLFDHRPKMVEIVDRFGPVKVWR